MGSLACGCEVTPGRAVSLDLIKTHYQHTFASLIFWEIIVRRGIPDTTYDNGSIGELRLKYLSALEKAFPEIQG